MKIQLQIGFGLAGLAALAMASVACGSSSSGGTGGAAGSATDGGAGHLGIGGKLGGSGGGSGLGGSGVGGAVCTSLPYSHSTNFNGGTFDGFAVPAGNPTTSLAPVPGVDGGPPSGTIQTLDDTVGSGSAKLQVPFSGPGQQLLFAQNYAPPLNLTGATVTADIRLDSGAFSDPINSVVRAFLVLKSGPAYTYATGESFNLVRSTTDFTQLKVVANTPNMLPLDYNPCDIREIDIEIDTGPMGTYVSGVLHIDNIVVAGPPGDGGASDASDASDAATTDAPVSTPDATPDTDNTSDAAAPSDASAG
jgi:hypothetical protein